MAVAVGDAAVVGDARMLFDDDFLVDDDADVPGQFSMVFEHQNRLIDHMAGHDCDAAADPDIVPDMDLGMPLDEREPVDPDAVAKGFATGLEDRMEVNQIQKVVPRGHDPEMD